MNKCAIILKNLYLLECSFPLVILTLDKGEVKGLIVLLWSRSTYSTGCTSVDVFTSDIASNALGVYVSFSQGTARQALSEQARLQVLPGKSQVAKKICYWYKCQKKSFSVRVACVLWTKFALFFLSAREKKTKLDLPTYFFKTGEYQSAYQGKIN